MIIYYTLQRVAMTCNYSAKNSSVIYNTYHNFARFAIIQDRIPFPQFVLDYPLPRSVFLDKKKPPTSFLVEGSLSTRCGVKCYLLFDLLCTRRCFQSFKRCFWSFFETRQMLNLNSQVLSNVTHDLSFCDR